MKISNIDKDFVDIVKYLNKNKFRPFSSCDGVLANHQNPNNVTSAYLGLLKSPRIIELISHFLEFKCLYETKISNDTYIKPYYLYGNLICGNQYLISFYNKNKELTSHFEKTIEEVVREYCPINYEIYNNITKIDKLLEETKNSELNFTIAFNSKYQLYMNKTEKINVLTVTTKEGLKYYKNMNDLIEKLSNRYDIIKKIDKYNEVYLEKAIEQIEYIKKIEHMIPNLKNRNHSYDIEE